MLLIIFEHTKTTCKVCLKGQLISKCLTKTNEKIWRISTQASKIFYHLKNIQLGRRQIFRFFDPTPLCWQFLVSVGKFGRFLTPSLLEYGWSIVESFWYDLFFKRQGQKSLKKIRWFFGRNDVTQKTFWN